MDKKLLPKYQCHKIVSALKLAAVDIRRDCIRVVPDDPAFAPFDLPAGWKSKWTDDPGYYVVYADGYTSWSPTKAFEDGYTPLKNNR